MHWRVQGQAAMAWALHYCLQLRNHSRTLSLEITSPTDSAVCCWIKRLAFFTQCIHGELGLEMVVAGCRWCKCTMQGACITLGAAVQDASACDTLGVVLGRLSLNFTLHDTISFTTRKPGFSVGRGFTLGYYENPLSWAQPLLNVTICYKVI